MLDSGSVTLKGFMTGCLVIFITVRLLHTVETYSNSNDVRCYGLNCFKRNSSISNSPHSLRDTSLSIIGIAPIIRDMIGPIFL